MLSSIFLAAALQQQAPHQAVHRVIPGDTLSTIAPSMGLSWPQLYAINRSVIGGNPNLIYVGEVLHAGPVTRSVTDYTPVPASGKVWGVSYGDPNYCGDGDGDGWDVSCAQRHQAADPAPAPAPARAADSPASHQSVTMSEGSYHGGGGMQSCIIARESGGNSQVTNASGHYGLYQFSYSTWTGSGGSGADFGHASVAEQNQVFANAVAARGYSDWAPYDHC
jgi:LysM repeat protein